MQGIRFRILLISFFASVCFSTPVARSNKQSLGTNDTNRSQSQIRTRDIQLTRRLQDIALYAIENQETFINLYNNLDKIHLFNDKWKDSSGLNPQSKEFVENILEKIDDAVREHNILDEKIHNSNKRNSSDKCVDQGNVTIISEARNDASNTNFSSDNKGDTSGNQLKDSNSTDQNAFEKFLEFNHEKVFEVFMLVMAYLLIILTLLFLLCIPIGLIYWAVSHCLHRRNFQRFWNGLLSR